MKTLSRTLCAGLLAVAAGAFEPPAAAPSVPHQGPAAANAEPLDSLVARALAVNPSVRAAEARAGAAAERVRPAGTRPDPMLMAGIVNLPVSDPGFRDEMTMKMVGVTQTIPYPGKLPLRRQAARDEVTAAAAMSDAARLQVVQEVRAAYYQLAFLDRAMEVLENNRTVLQGFVAATESRYGVGTGGQQDVLKARVELAGVANEAAALTEERRAALARLNVLLDRPVDAPLPAAAVPERIVRAAVAADPAQIRFATTALGSRVEGSPLLPIAELQERAVRSNPELRAQDAMIAAQAARADLAAREHLPDFDVSLQYGQRSVGPDMLTATVSVPLPINRRNRQGAEAAASRADLAALQADRAAKANEVRGEVARLVSELERDRTQLALYVRSIIPQGRASLQSATAGFQVGRVDFVTLLENRSTLYEYETAYHRALTGFATNLAMLERVVGGEVLR
ncbi:MAG: TolC family protein [Longimicrobiaceae bacterium]